MMSKYSVENKIVVCFLECGKPRRLLQDCRYQNIFEEASSGIKFQIFTATKV
jgi:hypothetical protein